MNLRRVLLSIVFVIGLFVAKHFYHVYEEHQALDKYADSVLSGPFDAPLDCPPYGQLKVRVFPSETHPEFTEHNATIIISTSKWPTMWAKAYEGIRNEAAKDHAEDKLKQKASVEVDLPDVKFSDDAEWSIHLDGEAGYFHADMKGEDVVSIGYD